MACSCPSAHPPAPAPVFSLLTPHLNLCPREGPKGISLEWDKELLGNRDPELGDCVMPSGQWRGAFWEGGETRSSASTSRNQGRLPATCSLHRGPVSLPEISGVTSAAHLWKHPPP